TNGAGTSPESSEEFEYEELAPVEAMPTIDSFSPAKGKAGTSVAITGAEFAHALKVEFGTEAVSCPGADCTIPDNEHLTVKATSGVAQGTKVKLKFATGVGSAVWTGEFEYEAEPPAEEEHHEPPAEEHTTPPAEEHKTTPPPVEVPKTVPQGGGSHAKTP